MESQKKLYVLGGLVVFGLAIGLGLGLGLGLGHQPKNSSATTKEESAVLMLSTYKDTNVPMVISLKGESDLIQGNTLIQGIL